MKRRIVYIDVLRAIAIATVILFHFLYNLYPNDLLRYLGFFGVSLFFIISGFILAKKCPKLTSFSTRWFAKRYVRVALIYLFAMLTVAFLFGRQSYYRGDLASNILVHIFFLDPFFPQYAYSIISPAWFFVPLIGLYLLFPYLNRLIRKDARLLVIPFIVMAATRISCGTLTSYSPLFYIGEFCFGIAFAYGRRNLALFVSFIAATVNPIMFLPFAAFYVFSFLDFRNAALMKVVGAIAPSTIELFLFHESFINIVLGKWTVLGTNVLTGFLIFLAFASAAVYLSHKINGYILSRKSLFI
jgi:peptidoglycan/LPS O-acetylase OafA/YrhL